MLKTNLLKLLLFYLLLNTFSVQGSIFEKLITLSVENKILIDVLYEIEEKADITFSFKSDLIDRDRVITLSVVNRPIHEILNDLFINKPIVFKDIGNQIVLYSENSQKITTEKNAPPIKPQSIIINDTIFKYINTTNIKVYDTTRYVFYDTIRNKPKPIKHNFALEFGFSPLYNFPQLSTQNPQYSSSLDIITNTEKHKFSYRIYGKFHTSINKLNLTTGIIYSTINEIANYTVSDTNIISSQNTITTWVTELESSSYKITGGGGKYSINTDTSWTYIYIKTPIDSVITINTIDTFTLKNDKINKYELISIPFLLGYKIPLSNKFSFSINSGSSIDFLISKTGHILNPKDNLTLEDFNTVPFIKINLSLLINAGINYKFNSNWEGIFHVNYYQGLQSLFSSDFPFEKIPRSIDFSVGCSYSF